ncbi:MAG: DnaJ domain-containing protein [Anaerolineales bacterium]|jgi:Ca-activated chloride channel family protein|nr:DnaJ domain-containing protein [Anaerolineales bacterium]
MPLSKPDYYAILGVLRDATEEEIKRAYFQSAQRLHPDKNTVDGETELFLETQQAYEALSNPRRRRQYDATLPPEIEANKEIRHVVYLSRQNLVRIGEKQLVYLLLEVGLREEKDQKLPAPPLNICLVLDRSTSMRGERLDIVKATAIQLMRRMRPQDVFSIVTFNDHAEVIVPASVSLDKKLQEGRIQMIRASGATEIYKGLEAGMNELQRALDPSRINHLILLTDGNTYGDEKKCLKLAGQAAAQNIGISGMGIGHEWNDIFLDQLASKTGGSSAYISKPKDIERLLLDKFNTLNNTYADDVLLEYKEQEHIKINYVFRLQPEGGPVEIGSPMHLGPILMDDPLHVLLEFVIEPDALKEDLVELFNGALKVSVAARPVPVSPIRLRFTHRVDDRPSAEPPPTQILSALSRLTLYRMQERAQAAAEAGQFDAAARHLQNLATHLLSQGEHSLAKTALFEAENLEKMHAWSDGGSKDIKYSTRALLLTAVKKVTA